MIAAQRLLSWIDKLNLAMSSEQLEIVDLMSIDMDGMVFGRLFAVLIGIVDDIVDVVVVVASFALKESHCCRWPNNAVAAVADQNCCLKCYQLAWKRCCYLKHASFLCLLLWINAQTAAEFVPLFDDDGDEAVVAMIYQECPYCDARAHCGCDYTVDDLARC